MKKIEWSQSKSVHGRAAILMIVLTAAGLALPEQAASQEMANEHVTLGAHAGIAIPASHLADLTDTGPGAGLDVTYHFLPRLAIEAATHYDRLQGKTLTSGATSPDMNVWYWSGGIEANLLEPEQTHWLVQARAGAGAERLDSERFHPANATSSLEFKHTYFGLSGGLELGYAVLPHVLVFADGQAQWADVKKEDTFALTRLDPAHLSEFGSAVTFPLSLGVRAILQD
jgi:hypothetical protein